MAACILINFRLHPLHYYLHLCKLVRTTISIKIVGRTHSLPLIICNSRVFSSNAYALVRWFTFLWLAQLEMRNKHCQRHNGPEGWVHLAKVTTWGYITSSYTNLDHISSSESRLSIHFTISIKHSLQNQTSASRLNFKIQNIDQTKLQDLDQDSTLYPLQNISGKILTKPQLKNVAWTSI